MAGLNRRTFAPGSFNMLTGNRPFGWDPTQGPKPAVGTRAVSMGPVIGEGGNGSAAGGGRNENAAIATGPGGHKLLSGSFLVANNTFTAGAIIILWDYNILAGSDFAIGISTSATATNIATAISAFPNVYATASSSTVTVYWEGGTMDQVEFRVQQYGVSANFTTLVPSNGFLGLGDPYIGPPVLTKMIF